MNEYVPINGEPKNHCQSPKDQRFKFLNFLRCGKLAMNHLYKIVAKRGLVLGCSE